MSYVVLRYNCFYKSLAQILGTELLRNSITLINGSALKLAKGVHNNRGHINERQKQVEGSIIRRDINIT